MPMRYSRNYVVSALIALIASVAFWFTFRGLDAAENSLNALAPGHLKPVFVDEPEKPVRSIETESETSL